MTQRKKPSQREPRISGSLKPSLPHPFGGMRTISAEPLPNCRCVTVPVQVVKEDEINHPSHYMGDTPYEHVKVAEAWGLVGNAFLYMVTKYICRAGLKGSRLADLKKAKWYLDREVQRAEEEERTGKRAAKVVESLGGC